MRAPIKNSHYHNKKCVGMALKNQIRFKFWFFLKDFFFLVNLFRKTF